MATATEENNKDKARSAYNLLDDADSKIRGYKDSGALKAKAHEVGKRHYLIEVVNRTSGYLPVNLERNLLAIDASKLNTFWNKYYTDKNSPAVEQFDRNARLEFVDIFVSPESEVITRHTDSAKVQDGFEYVKDKKGKIVRDSLGKKIKKKKFKKVFADVTVIQREKAVTVNADLNVYRYGTTDIINSKPLSVEVTFTDRSSTYSGDSRAVCDTDHKYLKPYPAAFPHDETMIYDATYKLKDDLKSELHRIQT